MQHWLAEIKVLKFSECYPMRSAKELLHLLVMMWRDEEGAFDIEGETLPLER